MASVRCTLTLPLAAVVCVLVVTGVAATPGVAAGESLAATVAQDSSAVEASLALDRSTRRLIQQGLRNEGFDPGTPDGRFGLRTRAAIRDWQQSRGASPTGYLNRAEAELLRTAAPPPQVPEAPPPPDAVAAVDPSTSSAAAAPASRSAETDYTPASPAIVTAEEADPQRAAETNTRQGTRAGRSDGTLQLPPEILVDRHLLRAERLVAGGDPASALGQEAAERRRADAPRRRAEAERRRAARCPPGHVFRGCETCPEMVVMPGSAVALDPPPFNFSPRRRATNRTHGNFVPNADGPRGT